MYRANLCGGSFSFIRSTALRPYDWLPSAALHKKFISRRIWKAPVQKTQPLRKESWEKNRLRCTSKEHWVKDWIKWKAERNVSLNDRCQHAASQWRHDLRSFPSINLTAPLCAPQGHLSLTCDQQRSHFQVTASAVGIYYTFGTYYMPAGCATGVWAGDIYIYIYMAKASCISALSAFVSHTHARTHTHAHTHTHTRTYPDQSWWGAGDVMIEKT